jgi:hypothetical protein
MDTARSGREKHGLENIHTEVKVKESSYRERGVKQNVKGLTMPENLRGGKGCQRDTEGGKWRVRESKSKDRI